jgi:hypothetical protein
VLIASIPLALFCQADWYKSVSVINDDPFNFDITFHPLYKKGLTLEGNFASGKYYAVFAKKDFDRINSNPGHEETLELLNVTAANSSGFVSHFNKIGSASIPFVVELLAELNAYVGYASLLLSAAESADADRKSTATAMASLIAPGAVFERIIVIDQKEPGKYYVNLINTYKVMVQSEQRRYVVSRHILAIRVN